VNVSRGQNGGKTLGRSFSHDLSDLNGRTTSVRESETY